MFESLIGFFHIILYRPLFNLLVWLYEYVPGHDFGVAIILLTIIIRFILYPISVKAVNSQRALQKLQPQIEEIQKKYKTDKEKQASEMLAIYKKEKINPFSGLFLALIQLPILIALYQVFWYGLKPEELSILYSFIPNPGSINSLFLQIIDLAKPNIWLAVVSGIVQYYQAKMLLPKKHNLSKKTGVGADMAQAMQKQMVYVLPVITVIILMSLPSALGLYWTISGLFSIGQQYLIVKKDNDKPEPSK